MDIVDRISWRVQQLIPHEKSLIYIRDEHRKLVWVNDVYCAHTGMNPEQLLGNVGDEFFGEKHALKLKLLDEVLLFTEEPMIFEEQITHPITGETQYYISMKTVVPFEDRKFLVGVSIPLAEADDSDFEVSLASLIVQVLRLVRYGIT